MLSNPRVVTADPMFFGRAYKDTQPVPIFNEEEEEYDEAAAEVSNKRAK